MKLSIRSTAILLGMLVSALMAAPALAAYLDPPGRVARVSYIDGEVSFAPAGEDVWARAVINRSLLRGDRLWADRRSRIELQLGAAAIRLDQMSSAEILDLDDTYAQVFLAEGSLNLYVRRIWDNQVYEIATPTMAVVIRQPGSYRIDVDPNGRHTDVTVWSGGADAYGDRASFSLRQGEKIRFYDASLRDYRQLGSPRADNFDRFAFDRDRLMDTSPSLRYVSDDLIGYTDLDRYGRWSSHREYGAVWYPTRVSSGWAPYRHGHWAWIEPFGWTWVDDAPWGFAVSHYGRWVYVGNRWGWIPSPRTYRAVYSPALVAFVGGSNWSISYSSGVRPVGWFPLGPRDVWFPSYRVSSNYFTRVNVHNTVINNVTVVNVYNNYYVRGGNLSQVNYRYRETASAHTVVSQDVFTGGRRVQQGLLSPARGTATARGEVQRLAPVAPTARSLTGAAQASKTTPRQEAFQRQAVTSRAPAAAAASVPFRARQEALQREPGVPQAVQPRQAQAAAATQRPLRVVGQNAAPIDRQQVRGRSAEPAQPAAREQRAPARQPQSATPASPQRSDAAAPTRESPRPAVTPRAATQEPARSRAPQSEAARSATPRTAEQARQQPRAAPERVQPRAAQPAPQATPRAAEQPREQPRAAPEQVQPRAVQPAPQVAPRTAPRAAEQPRQQPRAAPAPERVQPRATPQTPQVAPRQQTLQPTPQQERARQSELQRQSVERARQSQQQQAPQRAQQAAPQQRAAPPPSKQTRQEDEDEAARTQRRDPPQRGRGRDGGGA